MNELPRSSRYRSQPQEPVSDEERNRLSAQLNDAYAEGSLTGEEYHQQLDRVFGARTLGELVPVVERLGKPATYDDPELVRQSPTGRPGELAPARTPRPALTLAVVGGGVAALVLIVLVLVLLL